ncbi:MAG: hypothetical protein JWR26_4369 [Pedosphaera sp.]|nr:hypothetical protein [Pedosphaera sp.]
MNTKNSSWVFAHGHQGEGLRQRMSPVLRAPRAQRHLSPALSASQQGTGRCLRTATGEDLERLVKIKCLDAACALGGIWAVDLVDHVDERLRLAKGTQRHEKTRKGTDRHEKARYFERVIFFLARRKGHSPVSAPMAKEGAPVGTVSRIVPQCPRLSEGILMFFFSELSHPGVVSGQHFGRGVETARNHPQPPAITRGNLFFYVSTRVLAAGQYGDRHGQGLTRTHTDGNGRGRCSLCSPHCARKWARRTGCPILASQLPTRVVRCAKSNLSRRIVGLVGRVVAGIAAVEFGLDGVSPYHLLDGWRGRPGLGFWRALGEVGLLRLPSVAQSPACGTGALQKERSFSKAEAAVRIGGGVFGGRWARLGCCARGRARAAAKGTWRAATRSWGWN